MTGEFTKAPPGSTIWGTLYIADSVTCNNLYSHHIGLVLYENKYRRLEKAPSWLITRIDVDKRLVDVCSSINYPSSS